MPLTANFLADFSSFINATDESTAATDKFIASAGDVGRAVDDFVAGASSNMKSVGESLVEFGKQTWSVLSSNEMKNFAGDVKTFVSGYVAEFAEAEAASTRLAQAVKGMGLPPEVAESYGEMATALQKVSTFSDEALTDTMTLFTTVGNVGPDQMEQAVKATMDLATVMQVDLATAATIVSKAASSNGEDLGKLGVILADTIPEGADFADVLKAIGAEMGGQFSAALDTTAGQMENMENQMSDVNEQVGEVFADNLQKLLTLFHSMPEGMQTFTIAAVGIGTALAPVLVSLGSVVSLLATTGLGAGIASAFTALLPFLGPVGLIAAGVLAVWAVWKYWDQIADLAKFVYDAIKTWMYDKLLGVINAIVGLPGKVTGAFKSMYDAVVGNSYVPDMITGIESEFGTLHEIMVVPTEQAVNACLDAFRQFETGFASLESRGFAAGGLSLPEGTDLAALNASMVGRVQDLSGLTTPDVIKDAYKYSTDFAPWRGESPALVGAGVDWSRPVNVTVNMSGMLSDNDPQTRSRVNDLVSGAVMQGMRNSRLLGTA